MIFSISEYLGFSDEDILKVFKEEGLEITAIQEPAEVYGMAVLQE